MKIKKLIYSLKFNALIFFLIIFMLLLNVLLPQERIIGALKMKEIASKNGFYKFIFYTLGFKDIPRSPLFLFLLFLFYFQLLVFLFKFSSKVLRKIKIKEPDYQKWSNLRIKNLEIFLEKLKKIGFKEFNIEGGKYFVLNELSPLGFIFFHLSFLLILTGALFLYYTREEIYLTIAKDQSIFLRDKDFSLVKRKPLFWGKKENFLLTLTDLEYFYEGNNLKDLKLKLKIKEASSFYEGICKINYPLSYKGYKFYPLYKDLAFLIEIKNKEGYIMERAIIFSNCYEGENKRYNFESMLKAEIICKKTPYIRFTLEGEERVLPLKENIKTSFQILDVDIKGKIEWIKMMVVKEWGGFFLIFGFLLGLMGISFRFLFPKREIVLMGDLAYFKADYFNISFKNLLEGFGGEDGKI